MSARHLPAGPLAVTLVTAPVVAGLFSATSIWVASHDPFAAGKPPASAPASAPPQAPASLDALHTRIAATQARLTSLQKALAARSAPDSTIRRVGSPAVAPAAPAPAPAPEPPPVDATTGAS